MCDADMVCSLISDQKIKLSLPSQATSDMPDALFKERGTWKVPLSSSMATLMTPVTAAANRKVPMSEGRKEGDVTPLKGSKAL